MEKDDQRSETAKEPGKASLVARPLVPLVLALMAGIASPAWELHLPVGWLAAGLTLLWGALAWQWWRRGPVLFLPLAWFWLLGVAFCQQALAPTFPPQHLTRLPLKGEIILQGRLNRQARAGTERVQLFLAAESWRSSAGWRPARGNLLVTAPPLSPPPLGTGLVVRGRLHTPHALKNPGAFNRPRYLAADGIFREIRLTDPVRLVWLADTGAYPLGERLRGGIRQLLQPLDPGLRAVYLAMLLGDQGEISPRMRVEFARTGTSHLLVINGLHLGMVAAVTYFLSFWLLRRSAWLLLRINAVKTAIGLSAIPVVAYAWMAGGSPSTQRAEVMVLAYLLLVFLGRPREVWSALALAALVVLALAPLRLFSISFQLSFVAVAALIYLIRKDKQDSPRWGARLWFRGKEWLAVSAVATVATAPLVAAYFQVVSLLGIVVNLAAIPLVLGLALPLGEAAVLAQALSLTPLARLLLDLGQAPLWLGLRVVALGAEVPGSAFTMPIPSWPQIAACYLILILVFFPWRRLLAWTGAALAAIFLAATVALPPNPGPKGLEVTCLDGSGLSGLAVAPGGQRLAFTAPAPSWPGGRGGGWGALPGYCHWRQFRRLDLAVALDLGQDNARELLDLVRQFDLGAFWYGRRGREGPDYWDLWNFLGDRGALPRPLTGDRLRPPATLGEVALTFLQLRGGQAAALQLAGAGRRALILPPLRHLAVQDLPGDAAIHPDLLVLPAWLARGGEGAALISKLRPARLVIYGGSGDEAPACPPATPCFFTRKGAVSVYLSAAGTRVRQW